jgi:hypothetical protein
MAAQCAESLIACSSPCWGLPVCWYLSTRGCTMACSPIVPPLDPFDVMRTDSCLPNVRTDRGGVQAESRDITLGETNFLFHR